MRGMGEGKEPKCGERALFLERGTGRPYFNLSLLVRIAMGDWEFGSAAASRSVAERLHPIEENCSRNLPRFRCAFADDAVQV
jgi:hypothetical protein